MKPLSQNERNSTLVRPITHPAICLHVCCGSSCRAIKGTLRNDMIGGCRYDPVSADICVNYAFHMLRVHKLHIHVTAVEGPDTGPSSAVMSSSSG